MGEEGRFLGGLGARIANFGQAKKLKIQSWTGKVLKMDRQSCKVGQAKKVRIANSGQAKL